MEEITFLDILTHYQMKLTGVSDDVNALRQQLKKAELHIDIGWTGEAANACRLKLDTINSELTRVMSDLSEAQVKLSAIGELLTEEVPPVI